MMVCIAVRLVFMSCSVMVHEFVLMFVVYPVLLNVVCFLSREYVYVLLLRVVGVMDVVLLSDL